MVQSVRFEGKTYSFPDDADQQEIFEFLGQGESAQDKSYNNMIGSAMGTHGINQEPYENKSDEFVGTALKNTAAGLGKLGHGLLNFPHNLANKFSPEFASHIPSQPDYNFGQMLGLENTSGNEFTQNLVASSPSLLLKSTPLGKFGSALGPVLEGALGRAIPQAAFGAVTSEDPMQGAETGAFFSGLSELPPLALKGVGNLAERIVPRKYTQEIGQKIKSGYEEAKDYVSEKFFKPTVDRFSDTAIDSKALIKALDDSKYSKFYSPDASKLMEHIEEFPTLGNVKLLQDQLVKDRMKYNRSGGAALEKFQAADFAQKKALRMVSDILEKEEKGLGKLYEEGREEYRKRVVPYEISPLVDKISKGIYEKAGKQIPSDKLSKAFDNLILKLAGQDIEGHALQALDKDFAKAMEKSEFAQRIPLAKWVEQIAGSHLMQNFANSLQGPYYFLAKALSDQAMLNRGKKE